MRGAKKPGKSYPSKCFNCHRCLIGVDTTAVSFPSFLPHQHLSCKRGHPGNKSAWPLRLCRQLLITSRDIKPNPAPFNPNHLGHMHSRTLVEARTVDSTPATAATPGRCHEGRSWTPDGDTVYDAPLLSEEGISEKAKGNSVE